MDDTFWEGIDVSPPNISRFMAALENHRAILPDDKWKYFVETNSKLKEWRYFLLNDPYTRWGYVKPRGYPGDAVLMDFAYKHPSVTSQVEESNEHGHYIYEHTSNAPQSLSAVSRTKFIGDLIENRAINRINIASIASGHGREFEFISGKAKANIENVLAIDSDKKSLDELKSSSLLDIDVSAIEKNIFRTRLDKYGTRDLVYSLGLFDYLTNDAAIKVLENMCSCVSDSGTVVIANLHQQAANLGYCEAIMDWWMIPRSEEDLLQIANNTQNLKNEWSVNVERIDCFCYLIIETNHNCI